MKKFAAFLLALALTGILVLFCVSFIARQVIMPAMRENGAQASDGVIREEQELARERVTELAALYGFEAEPVIGAITEETIRDLNNQASRWWHTLLQDGKAGNGPEWNTDSLEEILEGDERLRQLEEQEEYFYLTAADEVRKSIIRMVLPMRLQTVRLGMQEIGKRVDLPNIITFMLGVPWAALALCALIAGLIALLQGKKFHDAALYIGSALGAAALVFAALVILYLCAGILPMIREASAGLTIQYQSVVSGALIRAGILTAAMAAGCVLCLAGNRKKRNTA